MQTPIYALGCQIASPEDRQNLAQVAIAEALPLSFYTTLRDSNPPEMDNTAAPRRQVITEAEDCEVTTCNPLGNACENTEALLDNGAEEAVTEACNLMCAKLNNCVIAKLNQLWISFKNSFLSIVGKHAPLITKKTRGIESPWMSGQIKKAMHQRDFQLRRARRSNADEDWKTYRSLHNQVTLLIRKTKHSYNKKLIEDNRDNPKAFWKTMNKILPGRKKKHASSTINANGSLIVDKFQIANAFNSYFTGTVKHLIQSFGSSFLATGQSSYACSDMFSVNSPINLFKFTSVSEQFTLSQLRKSKINKATGLDQIPARLMKDSAALICIPLTKIINISLESGHIPSEWKIARVIPLFKSGKAVDLDNYRPISVLPVASKILERAVHVQLYAYLTDKNYLSPYQCGFRKKHSTETDVIYFTDSVRRNIDQGLLTGAVFVDLRKAFDTIDHSMLLTKLQTYGIDQLGSLTICQIDHKWFALKMPFPNLAIYILECRKDQFLARYCL